MSPHDHAAAIAQIAVRRLDEAPPRLARLLLRPQLRWVAERPEESFARGLGVLELVESCRDEHLARLDADEGLAAILVPWEEIVAHAAALVPDPRGASRTPPTARRRASGSGRRRRR